MHAEYWQSSKDGQWYWHFIARNGKTVADAEGYVSRANVRRALKKCVCSVIGVRSLQFVEKEVATGIRVDWPKVGG